MTEAEVKTFLAPLFAQFGMADGDPSMKLLGYMVALERASPQALHAAVRAYLSGEVEGHDGKFAPTSAELARVVRAEQAHLNRITFHPLQIVDAREPTEEELAREEERRARMAAKFKALSARLGDSA